MQADHAFSIRVTPADAERALRRFLFRDAGWLSALAVAFCWSYFANQAFAGELTARPIGAGVIGLLLPLMYLLGYGIRARRNRELFRRLGDASIAYRFTTSRLQVESPFAGSSMEWDIIKELWVDHGLSMIFYARNAYMTLPTEQIPVESMRFLIQQVRQNGGKVRDRTRGSP